MRKLLYYNYLYTVILLLTTFTILAEHYALVLIYRL